MIYCNGKQNHVYNTFTILLNGHLYPVICKNVNSEICLGLRTIFISFYTVFLKVFDTHVLLLKT